MQTSQDGINLIKEFEGCCLIAYLDSVGQPTIGYGHTADVCEGMTITQAQADAYLVSDLRLYERYVNLLVTVPLDQHQFDALVSFTYNLGADTLKYSDVLAFVNATRYGQAADAILEYDHAGGVEVAGLTRRRQAERALFLEPPLPPQTLWHRICAWFIGQ